MASEAAFSVANAQGYLLTVFLQDVGRKIAQVHQSGEQLDLDNESLWEDVLTSSFTEIDPDFQEEWQAIQDHRKKTGWKEDEDESADLAYRFREIRAMTRSACRRGVLTRSESPTIESWAPKVEQ